jgi:hypothetical protein
VARREPRTAVFATEFNGVPAMAIYAGRTLMSLFFVEPGEDGRVAAVYVVRNPDKLEAASRVIAARPA